MAEDPHDAVPQTVIFLRMAAAQMRQIAASSEPGTAQQLRHMADQCEIEADELSEQFGIGPLPSN
jgi:hypothetical protein